MTSHTTVTVGAIAALLFCCQSCTLCTSSLRAATASSSLDTCSACSTYTSSPAGGNRPAGSVSVPTQFQLRVAAGQQSGASTHARTQRQYTGPR